MASPLAVAGTVGLLALALSVTAHIAARNVLGDVAVRKAFVVGPIPAVVAFVVATFSLPSVPGLLLAVLLDGVAITYVYEQRPRLGAYITLIHFVVSVILGAIVFGLIAILSSAPT